LTLIGFLHSSAPIRVIRGPLCNSTVDCADSTKMVGAVPQPRERRGLRPFPRSACALACSSWRPASASILKNNQDPELTDSGIPGGLWLSPIHQSLPSPAPFVPLSLCPFVPLSLCPFVPLSLCPFVPLSLGPLVPWSLGPLVPLSVASLLTIHSSPVPSSLVSRPAGSPPSLRSCEKTKMAESLLPAIFNRIFVSMSRGLCEILRSHAPPMLQ
jgi:hypothetical protein